MTEIKKMKKFFSTNYSDFSFNLAMFLLRIGAGSLLFINHGLGKVNRFQEMKDRFSDPFHIGSMPSLGLVVFAEAICSALIVLGLITRFAAFVQVILFVVITFVVSKGKPLMNLELPLLFLLITLAILFCGPGKWSMDKLIGK